MRDPIWFDGLDANLYAYVSNDPINEKDSLGWYSDDTHYGRTKKWALEAGVCPNQAETMAAADRDFDSGPTSPWRMTEMHFQQYEGFRNRPVIYETAMGVAQSGVGNSDAVQIFGWLLHQLQDTYSHENFKPDKGHIPYTWPDEWRGNKRDQLMQDATVRLLRAWKENRRCPVGKR